MEAFKSTSGKINSLISNGYQFRSTQYLNQAINLVKNNLGLFASFTLVFIAYLFFIFRLGQVGSFINIFLSGPISAGYYLIIHRIVSGQNYTFENFFDGFKIYLPVMIAAMAVNLLTSIGVMLFVVPGILVIISLLFVMPLIIFEKADLMSALRSSQMIVWKQFWEVGKFGLIIALINIAALFTFGIGFLFTMPMSFAAIYFAYADLIGIEQENTENKPDLSHFR